MKLLLMRQFLGLSILSNLTACCSDSTAKEAHKDLFSSNVKVRNEAALTLAGCGSKAHGSVSRLIQLLYDPNVGMQSSAAFALRRIDTPEARRALDKATKKRD